MLSTLLLALLMHFQFLEQPGISRAELDVYIGLTEIQKDESALTFERVGPVDILIYSVRPNHYRQGVEVSVQGEAVNNLGRNLKTIVCGNVSRISAATIDKERRATVYGYFSYASNSKLTLHNCSIYLK